MRKKTDNEKENAKSEGEALEQQICMSQSFAYGLEDSIFMEDIESRKLYLEGTVDSGVNRQINYFIMKYNEADKDIPVEERIPIKLYINSVGGSVMDGIGCLEVIKTSITPVWTICVSYALSIAFHIFVTGSRRFAMANSIFLNHDGVVNISDSVCKVKDFNNFNEKLDDRLDNYLLDNTKYTKKYLDDVRRTENYMFGDEAKKLGVVTDIIGVDCSIDAIY